eukprot:14011609-Alexandrium_andersonii.AAC.1
MHALCTGACPSLPPSFGGTTVPATCAGWSSYSALITTRGPQRVCEGGDDDDNKFDSEPARNAVERSGLPKCVMSALKHARTRRTAASGAFGRERAGGTRTHPPGELGGA